MADAVREKPPYKLDFLQTIVNVEWGGATEILPKANVSSPNIGADTTKLSIAGFFKVPNLLNGPIVFEFGPIQHGFSATGFYDQSYLGIDSGGIVYFQLSGRKLSISAPTGNSDDPGEHRPATPVVGGVSILDNPDCKVKSGAWNFIGISIDTTTIVGGPSVYYVLLKGAINTQRFHVSDDPYPAVVGVGFADGTGGLNVSISENGFGAPEDIPAFPIAIANTKFALPVQNQDFGQLWNVKTDYAKFRVWIDKAIDFDSPSVIAKFVVPNPEPDAQNPFLVVDESVAETAFGKPRVFLDKAPGAFIMNKGTGADNFVKTGTLRSVKYPTLLPKP